VSDAKVKFGRLDALDAHGEFVTVRRAQLLALLQLRFIAEGMSDALALEAAQRAIVPMTAAIREPGPL
jgi:hypothetical protein